MNLKRVFRILLGALSGVMIDNMTGISTFIIGMVPPPWNVLVGPVIGAVLNGGAKWLRDNSVRWEFKPTVISAPVKAVSKVL